MERRQLGEGISMSRPGVRQGCFVVILMMTIRAICASVVWKKWSEID
jgi:hypothetical protein